VRRKEKFALVDTVKQGTYSGLIRRPFLRDIPGFQHLLGYDVRDTNPSVSRYTIAVCIDYTQSQLAAFIVLPD
jgi:hypothetical protein